jgi:hypothetical protein
MATVIPKLMYREHCIKQGRDNIPTLTRKQKKALAQHNAAKAADPRVGTFETSYKSKVTVICVPIFNVFGEMVRLVPKGDSND